MKRRLGTLVVALCLACGVAAADEGMWLFNSAPVQRIKAKYGFAPSQAWLDHLRLGSVRFNNGGSGSFVSADGLAFTNHHVGRECVQDLSTKEKDYIHSGFLAKTNVEEKKCPALELNVLQGIEDVTPQVQGAAKSGMNVAEAGQAQREMMTQLEAECTKESGLRCEVVTFYAGGLYQLYKYKRYTDVRLVFVPEERIAFFGGDPDNFEFPRYDLDIAFFRAYENGRPVHLKSYLKFSHGGVKDGELVFVSGNPGRTERLLTMAQLNFLRDVQTPFTMKALTQRYQALKAFADESTENARIASDDVFGYENALKAYKGRYAGLMDKQLMDEKAKREAALRQTVDGDPKMKSEYGGAWDAIAKAVQREGQLLTSYFFIENLGGFAGEEPHLARLLVRIVAEKQKPSSERLREYGPARLPSVEQQLFSTAPVYKGLDSVELAASLRLMQEQLGPENVVVKQVLGGRSAEAVAKGAIENTKLNDVSYRKHLYEGGLQAVEQSNDPLIVLMRNIEPEARAIRKQWDDEVDSVLRDSGTLIAKARFAVQGTDMYPDATFTLRLSYGVMKGYQQNGNTIPYSTNLGGAFEHAALHGNRYPYELPKSWIVSKPALNLKTPYNDVSTPDIIGGNSGSPVVDKRGEVVGIVFDGNIQSLSWDFQYDDRQGRGVQVDTRAIIEALRMIYRADALLNELMNGRANAATKSVPAN
ncbi:MAG: S46 family peptidase [Candidatus Korobacteraceae bacterium]